MTNISGKNILLTGASGGLGKYIAQALVKNQANVVGVSRSQKGLETFLADIETAGGNGIAIPFDITKVVDLPILVRQVERRVGSVDILINNAGLEIYRAFPDYSIDEIQAIVSTNLLAAMELSRLFLPKMLDRKSGHIVNIASLASKKGSPYDSIYSASKAGLLVWSDAIRQELVGTGVEVSVICPGYISQCGMFVNTGVRAPSFSGTSTPATVTNAIVQAIKKNQAEVIVSGGLAKDIFTKCFCASIQLYPILGDIFYRWIGVPTLNKLRVEQTSLPSHYLKQHSITIR
ncbi:MAG: SDR family NAD(P)-dependent oxidoreductase [Cyanobacteria bacterium P01_G01_bin.67]